MKYVIVRTLNAGVHVGYLKSRTDSVVTLLKSSRIWRWRGANTLDELSLRGGDEQFTRISEQVEEKKVLGVLEVITCTELAKENLSRPRWGL